MTREEFKKYEGKDTFGETIYNFNYIGGTIVGYSPNDDDLLFTKVSNGTGNPKNSFDLIIPSEKESHLYEECKQGVGYSYLWCSIDNVKI